MKHKCQAKSSEGEHSNTWNMDSANLSTADQSRCQPSSRKTGLWERNPFNTDISANANLDQTWIL